MISARTPHADLHPPIVTTLLHKPSITVHIPQACAFPLPHDMQDIIPAHIAAAFDGAGPTA
jgi:hypothetical protein